MRTLSQTSPRCSRSLKPANATRGRSSPSWSASSPPAARCWRSAAAPASMPCTSPRTCRGLYWQPSEVPALLPAAGRAHPHRGRRQPAHTGCAGRARAAMARRGDRCGIHAPTRCTSCPGQRSRTSSAASGRLSGPAGCCVCTGPSATGASTPATATPTSTRGCGGAIRTAASATSRRSMHWRGAHLAARGRPCHAGQQPHAHLATTVSALA